MLIYKLQYRDIKQYTHYKIYSKTRLVYLAMEAFVRLYITKINHINNKL